MKPTLAERLTHISASIKLAMLTTGPLILNVDIKEAKDKPAKQVGACECCLIAVWVLYVRAFCCTGSLPCLGLERHLFACVTSVT
jgi:hypothetical protein